MHVLLRLPLMLYIMILALAVLFFCQIAQDLSYFYHYTWRIPYFIKGFFFNFFSVASYFYVLNYINKNEAELLSLLKKLFTNVVIGTFFIFALEVLMKTIYPVTTLWGIVVVDAAATLQVSFIAYLLSLIFVYWKKLNFYRFSNFLSSIRRILEYLLFTSLCVHFFQGNIHDEQSFLEVIFNTSVLFLSVFVVVLSINFSWISFLNFKEKITALFILSALIGAFVLLYQVVFLLPDYRPLVIALHYSIPAAILLLFGMVYASFCILVLFFNLPTTSFFEKKFNEIADFERLLKGNTEQYLHDVILEIAFNTFRAEAAILEINFSTGLICAKIPQSDALNIKESLSDWLPSLGTIKKLNKIELGLHESSYETYLLIPFISHHKLLGTLVLLSSKKNAFDILMISLINTFATQASIALDNFRLIAQAVETERYKTEIETAKRVQTTLLPHLAFETPFFELFTRTYSPEEVGGDFYDYCRLTEHKYVVLIGDVSGKGISAAFNMAQMKGVFQALVQLDFSPDLFLNYANNALSQCLAKNSFITVLYLIIDTKLNNIYYARAGHCPLLYFSVAEQKATFLESKGLGLGILRNNYYANYTEVKRFNYQKGDLILLYTDGIVEAKELNKIEEYGYERLQNYLQQHHGEQLSEIGKGIFEDLYQFGKSSVLQDDCTLFLLRFL